MDGGALGDFLRRIGGREIVLFGAGPTAREFLDKLPLPVAWIADNDERLWGGEAHGLPVRPPAELPARLGGRCVVIASSAEQEIRRQLAELGLDLERDVCPNPLRLDDAVDSPEARVLVSALGENGGLWAVDLGAESAERIVAGDCRGIARLPDGLVVAFEHEGVVRLDREFREAGRWTPDEDLNLHGLAADLDRGLLYVNETARDRIGVLRLADLSRVGEFDLAPCSRRNSEQRHVNDVALRGGALYASMFSLEGVWRDEIWGDGAIVRLDPESGRIEQATLRGLQQPHTILFDGRDLVFCNSMTCEVRRNGEPWGAFQGYVRGLARVDGWLLVGQSRARRLSRFRGRFSHVSLDSGLHLWNPARGVSRFLKLPVDGVFAILPLDGSPEPAGR